MLLIMLIYFTAVKLRRLRWAGHVPQMGKTTNAYNIFVRKALRICDGRFCSSGFEISASNHQRTNTTQQRELLTLEWE